ncbi:FKBP-type peptidyl-prolyl cis-trans isomerase N-terminal domain-containing protein [Erwinia aphidicola]|uniref:FKBP-type peptidyl-prolyl cis-trans isomerase N-terminal domain-containing protein n=1 Tax=Erwinia aphidicola TaxID=68334 RepID=UPI0030162F1A
MKSRNYSGTLLALTLCACSACAQGEERYHDDTISSLEAITRQVDEAPALLLLTPSQIDEAKPSDSKRALNGPAALGRETNESAARQVREMKVLQAKINRLKGKIISQEVALDKFRKMVVQPGDYSALQGQLSAKEQEVRQKSLQVKQLEEALAAVNEKHAQQSQRVSELQLARQTLNTLKEQLAKKSEEVELRTQDLGKLQQKLAALEERQAAAKTPAVIPEAGKETRDYAIGTVLGDNVLAMLDGKKSQGVDVSHKLALAGISDRINGQVKLGKEQISTALSESERVQNNFAVKRKAQTENQGVAYVDKFRKQRGVIKSDAGFYYRVDKAGDKEFGEDDTVTVAVRESLTDGRVIKDMIKSGASVSQPLFAYPALFREALKKLKNHGSMTLVVPPALAYGDKGMGSDIPPGATIIYTLTVLDTIPSVAE